MTRQLRSSLVVQLFAVLLLAGPLACGGSLPDDAGPVPGLVSLSLSPTDPSITQDLDSTQSVTFTVRGTFSSGETRDLTNQASLAMADGRLGSFSGSTLTTTQNLGGQTNVVASVGSVQATTGLRVTVKVRVYDLGAPLTAEETFGQCAAGGHAPTLVYPESGTLVPPNLSELEVMWSDAQNSLWELSVSSPTTDIRVYTRSKQAKLTGSRWSVMASSNQEDQVTIGVRGIGDTHGCGASTTRTLLFAREAVRGGLYYWAATDSGGIIRYDFGTPDQKAEPYYTAAKAGQCVACHTISPDGKRMAVTFAGGDGPAGILDVKTGILTNKGTYRANFQVFTPDNAHLIGSSKGDLYVRDAATGAEKALLNTGGKATMPEVSPDGKQLVFVRPESPRLDWNFEGGSIVTAPLNGLSLGAPKVLVQGSACSDASSCQAQNNYYPAFSPDGQWIILNRSSGDSYSDDDAALHLVSATGGAPIALARVNQGESLRNSWARWSPFVQQYKGHTLLWFTFSSTRDYGTALVNSSLPGNQRTPQIWMAAVVAGGTADGQDPSFPAFWLPFQDKSTNNHIAQWTQKVIGLE